MLYSSLRMCSMLNPWQACPLDKPCCWDSCEYHGDYGKLQCQLCKFAYHEDCRLQACKLQKLMGTGKL